MEHDENENFNSDVPWVIVSFSNTRQKLINFEKHLGSLRRLMIHTGNKSDSLFNVVKHLEAPILRTFQL